MGLFLFQYLGSTRRKRILATYAFKIFTVFCQCQGAVRAGCSLGKVSWESRLAQTLTGQMLPVGHPGSPARSKRWQGQRQARTEGFWQEPPGYKYPPGNPDVHWGGRTPPRLCWNVVLGTLAGGRGWGTGLQVRLSRTTTSCLCTQGHFKLWHEFLTDPKQISAIIYSSLLLQKKF